MANQDLNAELVDLLRESRAVGMTFEEAWAEDCRYAVRDLEPVVQEHQLKFWNSIRDGWRAAFERTGVGMSRELLDDVGVRVDTPELVTSGF